MMPPSEGGELDFAVVTDIGDPIWHPVAPVGTVGRRRRVTPG